MADDDESELGEELTAEEILTFGAVVESAVWTPIWLQEARAPIAVAAGRPKLGPVFNSDGVGRAVVIRPCISRGRRVRGLSPIYTPAMLESNAKVFDGWPMFMDHVPPELAEKMAKHGRSVKELGGQLLKGWWDRDFLHEDDGQFGYRQGGVLAEIWATPVIRGTVGENPNLLHTSINAWPKSGKPGPVPWRPKMKGMLIEGIRRVPTGSLDFVVRGGAGGRLLVQEGMEEEGAWPETGDWSREDVALVVSVAESVYSSRQMPDKPLPKDPAELKAYLQENAPALLPALAESAEDKGGSGGRETTTPASTTTTATLSEADVIRITEAAVAKATAGAPTVEEFETKLEERATELIREGDEQRRLAGIASKLIQEAKGIPDSWKKDLTERFAVLPDGPARGLQATLAEAETADDKSAEEILREAVTAELDHSRNLIADARGKPRVTGEGGKKADAADGEAASGNGKVQEGKVPFWRERFADMRIVESEDEAVAVYGGKPKAKTGKDDE